MKIFSVDKVASIFSCSNLKSDHMRLEQEGVLPPSRKFKSGIINRKGWDSSSLPLIGREVGFIKRPKNPLAVCVFTTKGGALKSTIALNMARVSALHGLKTCVLGLDIQGDVTTALGFESELDDCKNIEEIIGRIGQTKGLADLFCEQVRLEDIIHQLDFPNLYLIPETPELAALSDSLSNRNRREFWLKECVVDKLKSYFDIIIMDCSPNWNKLTTNALVACDLLVSPLECKINNFRNFKLFMHFLENFQNDMRMDFANIFVPTCYSMNKKLSLDIRKWYRENISACSLAGIRESVVSEEASAMNLSVVEHSPKSDSAKEMRELMVELFDKISELQIGTSKTEIRRNEALERRLSPWP